MQTVFHKGDDRGVLSSSRRENQRRRYFITGKAAIADRNFDATRRSRAARLCRAACAHSAQGKQQGRLKPNSFGSQPALLFPVARELACRHIPDTRKQVAFSRVPNIAKMGPGTNLKQPPVADILLEVRSAETSNVRCADLRRLRLRNGPLARGLGPRRPQ